MVVRQEASVTEETSPAPRFLVNLREALRSFQYSMQSDEEIIRHVRAGDHEAFDALVLRYRDRIYGLAIASLGNQAEASEAVCQAFLSAFRDVNSIAPDCTTGTWLCLHGLRAVFARLEGPQGGYSIEARAPIEAEAQEIT